MHMGAFSPRGGGVARGSARSVLPVVLVRWRWFRGGLRAASRGNLGHQPLCSLVAALVGRTGNDRGCGRRAGFSEPDRLSREPRNPSNKVRWIRLADPSRRPLAKNAPSFRRSVDRRGHTMSAIRDQVALVTGSSRGIGAAIARLYAQHGAKVVVHGRDGAALSSVRREIELAGGRAMQVSGDVTSFSDIEAARLRIEGEFGPVDILVANAGGSFTPPGPLEDTSEEGWHASVEGNLTATFLTIKSFLPGMKERRSGSIITISSAAGRRPHPRSPIPYSVAKSGIELMSQDVAAQAGPYGIRVHL